MSGSGRRGGLLGARESVALHDLAQRGVVRGTVGGGVEDRGDLAEVVGPEDPGRDDRERLGVRLVQVLELVDGAPRDAERLAGADIDRAALDGPGQHALETVDGLLVAVVAVRGREAGARRDVELEDRDRAAGLLALDQEPDRERPDPDLLLRDRVHVASCSGLVKSLYRTGGKNDRQVPLRTSAGAPGPAEISRM